nr:uncharacterized protein LOC110378777 [Helicoverpa armigera]XP_049699843.1 uncharacterized protein LOC110378777 [Helicoverpa armigera]
MSDWTNLEDIMQDLSVAQGCVVPASLETFGAECPPAYYVQEEGDQHSHYDSADTIGGSIAPDYSLIQLMLNMVNKPSESHESDAVEPDQPVKKKFHRNVALTSILAAKEAEQLDKQPFSTGVIPTMFIRKAASRAGVKTDIKSPPPIVSTEKRYSPSPYARECQRKYEEKKEIVEDKGIVDIWSKAERQMKEIEERKKRSTQLVSPADCNADVDALDAVKLYRHRHEICDDCIVCSVAHKHGYHF